MFKKIIALTLLITSAIQAQHTLEGTMYPYEKDETVILYRITGAKQKYYKHAKVATELKKMNGKKDTVGFFKFDLPKDMKPGIYRLSYRQKSSAFLDVVYNNEDIKALFHPSFPEESVVFKKSKENKVYKEFKLASNLIQTQIDSVQDAYLQNPTTSLEKTYQDLISQQKSVEKVYNKKAKNLLVNDYIKAEKISNKEIPFSDVQNYMKHTIDSYFENIDFNSEVLYNSPVIINKITDYIFYLNFSDNQEIQQDLYKESITKVMSKIANNDLRKEVLHYLITRFTNKRNSGIVDWLISSFYNKLPANSKDLSFINKKLELIRATVGRTAPDFSWKDNGKSYSLSSLKNTEKYLLVFWSTQCSHCVEQIPELHEYMKTHKNVTVIAFAIEDDDLDFNSWKTNKLLGWHNVLGTHPEFRFKNKTVRDYQINQTPSYFILNKDKKIIAMPNELKDIKYYLEKNKK